MELLPVRPQAVALHPGVRNGRSEVLAGLGLHVAGDADPALVIDPLRMPQLMGPEAIGGDASKHPLVKSPRPKCWCNSLGTSTPA